MKKDIIYIHPLLRVFLLTVFMFLLTWLLFELGKFLYGNINHWRWAFDRQALWSIYLLTWGVVFLIYNLILTFSQKKNDYLYFITIFLWIIPFLIFKSAFEIRPMSVLAMQLAVIPVFFIRLWNYKKYGI